MEWVGWSGLVEWVEWSGWGEVGGVEWVGWNAVVTWGMFMHEGTLLAH